MQDEYTMGFAESYQAVCLRPSVRGEEFELEEGRFLLCAVVGFCCVRSSLID